MAMMISRVARVNSSHTYLENDSSSSLVSHRLRISPWLRFSSSFFENEAPGDSGESSAWTHQQLEVDVDEGTVTVLEDFVGFLDIPG